MSALGFTDSVRLFVYNAADDIPKGPNTVNEGQATILSATEMQTYTKGFMDSTDPTAISEIKPLPI